MIAPQAVTATLPPFYNNPLLSADNLIVGISPATGAGTTFPYSPNDEFNEGIGYLSQYTQWHGSITYTFQQAAPVSQIWLWNAYFNFELDHSLKIALLTFRDEANQIITTQYVSFPTAIASVLTPDVVDLPEEVPGVKNVEVTVDALWGGNEISLRRMAFAGTDPQTGIGEAGPAHGAMRAYPNPGHGSTTIEAVGVVAAEVFDATGRAVAVAPLIDREHVTLPWAGCAAGAYHVLLYTRDGRHSLRLLVE